MKIIVVSHTYLSAINQAKYVAMKRLEPKIEVILVVPESCSDMFGSYKPERNQDIKLKEMAVLRSYLNKFILFRFLNPFQLIALLKTFKPDVVYIEEDPHSAIGIETIVLAKLAYPKAKISFFIWDNIARTPTFPVNLVKKALTRFSLANCQLVICGNKEGRDLLLSVKKYNGLSYVIPQLGLEPADFEGPLMPEVVEKLKRPSETVLLGFLGRLTLEKGVLLLLETLSKLINYNWKLLIVGNGPLKDEIRTKWNNVFGERLIVLDGVSRVLYRQYLKGLDVLVVPSYGTPFWKEQFGYNIAEAMITGVPCIGSSSGAIPEVMGPGGLVFPEREVEGLAEALKKMIENKSLREELGRKARAFSLDNYTNDVIARRHLDAFKTALNS